MKLLITLFSLFLGSLFLFAGNSLFLNATNIDLQQSGTLSFTIGLINTSYFLGATLSSVAAHRIVSRVGHNRSFSFFAAVMAICILLHTLTNNIYIWGLLRMIQGFCYYGVLMVIESWLNEKSDTSIRSSVLGFYEIIFYIAFSIGALVLNLVHNATSAIICSAVFLILAILPLSLTKMATPQIPEPKKISIPSVYSIVPLALIGSFIGGFIVNGFISMAPVYTLNMNYTILQTSIFITCSMIGGFVIQMPMGKFSDSYGRRFAISIAATLTFVAAILSIMFAVNIHAQYLLAFLFGCGAFTIYPLSLARANDVLPDDSTNRLEVSRSMLFAYGLGALTAPTILGLAMQYFKASGFQFLFAVLSVFLAIFALFQRKIPKEDRNAYVPVTANTTNSLIVDPSEPDNDSNN